MNTAKQTMFMHLVALDYEMGHNKLSTYTDVVGICANVQIASYSFWILKELETIFITWEEYSGNPSYPISTCDVLNPQEQFGNAWVEGTLWDINTEYTRARVRLLRHCIDTLILELGMY